MQITSKSPKLGNYLHYTHQSEAHFAGYEQILTGYEQVIIGHNQVLVGHEQIQVGTGEDGLPIYAEGDPIYGPGDPIYANGDPIYEKGVELFSAEWNEAWGNPVTDDFLVTWEEPEPEQNPVTDVEKMAAGIQERLDQRQLERTGIKPDPKGAVPRTRALAAAAMSLGGWGYPSVAALTGDAEVVAILAALYADPTSNTTAESSNTAKRRAVQYVRIMAEGAAFGEEYSDALTAYERTASPGIQGAITADQRDWMALPCGPWATVKAMFLALLK